MFISFGTVLRVRIMILALRSDPLLL